MHRVILALLLLCAAVQSASAGQGGGGGGRSSSESGQGVSRSDSGFASDSSRTSRILDQAAKNGMTTVDAEKLLAPVYTARTESLPTENILTKIEEGLAKQVAPALIEKAAEARLNDLRLADELVKAVWLRRGSGAANLTSRVALALESGLPVGVLQVTLKQSKSSGRGRIIHVIDAGEALHLAGFKPEQTQLIMTDCIDRKLSPTEMDRVVNVLVAEHAKDRKFESIYAELWIKQK